MIARVWVLGLVAAVCGQQPQSPTIDCTSMRLKSGHSFTITNSVLPHEVTCVQSSTTIDVTVKAVEGSDITDVMLQIFLTNSSSGLFLNPDDGDHFAVGCNGQAFFSTDRSFKDRVEALWYNSLGMDLTTKQLTCVLTLVDSRNKAWEAVSIPSITSEEYERQRLEALLGPENNAFASDAQQPTQETTTPEVNTNSPTLEQEPTSASPDRQPAKILNIPLSAVMFDQMPKNRAVPFGALPSVDTPSQTTPSNSLSPEAQARVRSSGTQAGTESDIDFMNPFGHSTARDPELQQPNTTNPTSAPTTRAATTTPTTTTTTSTTTTTPTTTTTTPTTTTTTTTPTTTTTTPTTTTTTPTTTTTTPTTTTTTPTTTKPTPRRATRPPTTATTTLRRRTLPPTTVPTTTTQRTTTTTQPVNLDQGEITVEGRTYEHHCLNGNLKRVLIPHTGCRYYMTLMNGLPGAFSSCPVSQREGQLCFDVVTCSCTPCYPTVCPPPPLNSERLFSVTVYNSQRDPIGSIRGEFIPNGRGGYNENIQINGLIDPGYLPLRNPDGSIQSTASPAASRRSNNNGNNNRRGTSRNRGGNSRGRINQNQSFGLQSLLGLLG